MNYLKIEKLREELSSLLPRMPGAPKLFILEFYYSSLLNTNNLTLINSFSLEFIEEYLAVLEKYSPFYSSPQRTQNLIDQLSQLIEIEILSEFIPKLKSNYDSINEKLTILNSILAGKSAANVDKGVLLFPLLGKITATGLVIEYSSVEKVRIKISYAKDKNTFIFVPSSQTNEQLEKQAAVSLQLALDYLNNHSRKFHKHHEILIYFENNFAEYEGDSLGIALTIGFIEQLSLLYNLPFVTHIKNKIVSTGGTNKSGFVASVGKESIVKKVETVFYSDIATFIIPKADEYVAREKLNELKNIFPNRALQLIPVETLDDLLNRRNLVDIKKQSPVVRAGKGIKRNWLASLMLVLLLLISIFIYIRDFDDNPSSYEVTGQYILIKNQSGKVLWQKHMAIDPNYLPFSTRYLPNMIRIFDSNSDGKNEVLISGEIFNESDSCESNRTSMYDHEGKLIWKYRFHDDVSSRREDLNTVYGDARIIDIIEKDKRKIVYLLNNNGPSFAGAIYKLDAKTGERIQGTLWNSGHILDGIIHNVDNDSVPELIYTFTNNGMGLSGIAIIDLDNVYGQGPTSIDYQITGEAIAKFIEYILVPQTDFSILSKSARGSLAVFTLLVKESERSLYFATNEVNIDYGHGIGYKFDYDLMDFEITPDDRFVAVRDAAIKENKLKPPFTDTKEFRELIKSQILYWNGKNFVKRNQLKKEPH